MTTTTTIYGIHERGLRLRRRRQRLLPRLDLHADAGGGAMSRRTILNDAMSDSPVERERKTLPRGDGNWLGFDYVYGQISTACERIAHAPFLFLSAEHVTAMAILGCGHEETMKAEMWRLRGRRFI